MGAPNHSDTYAGWSPWSHQNHDPVHRTRPDTPNGTVDNCETSRGAVGLCIRSEPAFSIAAALVSSFAVAEGSEVDRIVWV